MSSDVTAVSYSLFRRLLYGLSDGVELLREWDQQSLCMLVKIRTQ